MDMSDVGNSRKACTAYVFNTFDYWKTFCFTEKQWVWIIYNGYTKDRSWDLVFNLSTYRWFGFFTLVLWQLMLAKAERLILVYV